MRNILYHVDEVTVPPLANRCATADTEVRWKQNTESILCAQNL